MAIDWTAVIHAVDDDDGIRRLHKRWAHRLGVAAEGEFGRQLFDVLDEADDDLLDSQAELRVRVDGFAELVSQGDHAARYDECADSTLFLSLFVSASPSTGVTVADVLAQGRKMLAEVGKWVARAENLGRRSATTMTAAEDRQIQRRNALLRCVPARCAEEGRPPRTMTEVVGWLSADEGLNASDKTVKLDLLALRDDGRLTPDQLPPLG